MTAKNYETRCGWFDNPTPANYSLYDKDSEWIIGVQGGYQVDDLIGPKNSGSRPTTAMVTAVLVFR